MDISKDELCDAIDKEKTFKTFTCIYKYQGAEWCFHLKAENEEDVEARLDAIRNAFVGYDELYDIIPWNPGKVEGASAKSDATT